MSPTPTYPGVYIEEVPSGVRTIAGVPTSLCAFIGRTPHGPLANVEGPAAVHSFAEFELTFGELNPDLAMGQAVLDFFSNGGSHAVILRLHQGADATPANDETDLAQDGGPPLTDADYVGDAILGSGLHALQKVDLFNLLCIPPDAPQGDTSPAVYQAALQLCVQRRAILLVDPPVAWNSVGDIVSPTSNAVTALGLSGDAARNAALYFPRLLQRQGRTNTPTACVPCGAVAGVIARADSMHGVWKAPAGNEGVFNAVYGLSVRLNDDQNGLINRIGVNALRVLPPYGKMIWGARTLRGDDTFADDYKYLPVRRLALHIEESVSRGIAWAAFEPNDEALWSQLRLDIGTFMQSLFRQGAFVSTRNAANQVTARESYFVKCDAQTTSQNDINLGVCKMLIGFAPLKPGEFVLLSLQQSAGQQVSH